MLKRFIVVSLFLLNSFLAVSSLSNENVDSFMEDLEGKTLEEAIMYIKEEIKFFEDIVDSYTMMSTLLRPEIKVYEKDEERYTSLPDYFFAEELEQSHIDYLSQLVLFQEFNPPMTRIRIEPEGFGLATSRLGSKYSIKKIYYSDGTTSDIEIPFSERISFRPVADTELSFTPAKAIDSVRLSVNYSWVPDYTFYRVEDEQEIPGGKIEIKHIEGNMAEIELVGTAREYGYLTAVNEDNKILSPLSSSTRIKEGDKEFKLYAVAFKQFLTKTEHFKTIKEFKKEFRKMLLKLPPLYIERPKIYTSHFRGNVKAIVLYFPQPAVEKDIELTIVNKDTYLDLIFASDSAGNKGFIDKSGAYVIRSVDPELIQINNLYYYTSDSVTNKYTIYYLDLNAQELRKIPGVEKAWKANSECIAILKDNKVALLNSECEDVTGPVYDSILPFKGTQMMLVKVGFDYGIINSQGEVIIPVTNSYIKDFSEGYALTNNKKGPSALIDKECRIVLELGNGDNYDNVKDFSDGLLAVKRNNLWGFIDITGKTIIPFIYDEVKPFSNGITMVKYNEKYGLINKTGEIVVPITSGGYFMNTMNGIRTYTLNGVEYNQYGQKYEEIGITFIPTEK